MIRHKFHERGVILDRHTFTYEQYCPIVSKNIILEEITFYDGQKMIKCLHRHNCEHCHNKYVTTRIEKCKNQ